MDAQSQTNSYAPSNIHSNLDSVSVSQVSTSTINNQYQQNPVNNFLMPKQMQPEPITGLASSFGGQQPITSQMPQMQNNFDNMTMLS